MYVLISSRWAHGHIPGHVYKKVIRRKLEQVFPNMKTSHIHQAAIPLKSVLTARFPRKEHYRAAWKSANNVQDTRLHCTVNPKGLEVNWELARRTKQTFLYLVSLITIMLKHWLEEQRLKTALWKAGLVPYLWIFTHLSRRVQTEGAHQVVQRGNHRSAPWPWKLTFSCSAPGARDTVTHTDGQLGSAQISLQLELGGHKLPPYDMLGVLKMYFTRQIRRTN